MSRVAKMPIAVPAGAEVAITAAAITVKGPWVPDPEPERPGQSRKQWRHPVV